ncbi:MAG: YbaB/EbfC family nucleoid-associated protein [Bacilli bacterium]|jgi:DNA-binding protein YbaB|nr:YbaB/EbfC family nucleoid-associated protein [Bacilli bacterium]NLN80355.1 hypothetical protein [Erysipelotrichia bacterium]
MNKIKDLLNEAQKIDANLRQAHAELAQEQFKMSKNGLVSFTFYGDRTIKDVELTKEGLNPDNKELLEDTIKLVIHEILQHIKKAEDDINSQIMGSTKIEGLF